ncbi:MAG: HYR domain-containing protein [Verrucomicrobiota bacterium]
MKRLFNLLLSLLIAGLCGASALAVSGISPSVIAEGSQTTLTVDGAGTQGVSGTVSWGDGSSSLISCPGGSNAIGTHVYADNGTYTVSFVGASTYIGVSSYYSGGFWGGGWYYYYYYYDVPTTVSFQLTVNNVAPSVQSVTVPLSTPATYPLSFSVAATDPGVLDTISYSWDFGDGSPVSSNPVHTYSAAGEYAVRVIATDNAGAASPVFTQLITVTDSEAPDTAIVSGPDALINSSTATVTFSGTDNVAVARFEASLDGGTYVTAVSPVVLSGLADGSHSFSVRAVDAAGNTDASPATTTWMVDTTPPVLSLPSNVTASATNASGAVVNYTAGTATDAVTDSPVIAYSQASGTTFPLGTTTVTVTATDAASNVSSGTFTVTVADITPPVLSLPSNVAVSATNASGAIVNYTAATATDNVTVNPTIAYSQASGTTFPLGTTTVTVTATDGASQVSSGTFTVIVSDTTPPVLSLPTNVTASATSASGAIVNYTAATATDNVTVTPTIAYSQASGTTFPLGTSTVTVTATDGASHVSSGTFTVTVSDTTPPVLSLPTNVTASATNASGAVVNYTAATATDNVTVNPTIAYSQASGTTFPLGTTTVTVTATDGASQVSSGTFTVTVSDTTAPVLNLPSSVTAQATSVSGATVVYSPATATDNVTINPTITYSKASGTTFPIGVTTVTVNATDAASNVSAGTFNVTVAEASAPTFVGVPTNLIVEATSSAGAAVTFATPTASDNTGAVAVVSSVASGSVFPIGATTVTFSANNPVTNKTSTASFVVTVRDTTAPLLIVPSNVIEQATSASGAIVKYPRATISDAVTSSPPTSYSQQRGTTFPIGTTTVTVTSTDAAGNSSTGSFDVTVIDSIAPVISGVPSNITARATSTNGAVVTYTMPTATDAVGVVSLVASKASGSMFPMGTTTVTFNARDAANNTSTTSFDVTVVDATSPVLEGVPTNRTVEATSASGALVDYIMPTASDASGALTVVADKTSGSVFPVGVTTVTFTATNAATAKTVTASFTVTVSDTTAPVLIGLPKDMTVPATSASGATVSYTMPTATDAVGVTSLTASKESGSVFAIGATVVTVEAKDAAGHVTTGSFTVTVKDDAAPVIAGVPKNIIAKATSKLGAVVQYMKPTASDVVDGSVVEVTASKASGSVFPVGVTTVTFTATDAAHNTSHAGFTVTVKDTVGPALDGILTPLVLKTDASGKVALPDYTAQVVTSSDVVGGVKQNPAAGTLVGAGKTKVVLSVVDAAGRAAMLSEGVEVRAFPHITSQPENARAWNRSKASFSVVAEGYGELRYQWKKDGVALPMGNKAFYEVKKAFASDAGIYTVEVSNEVGSLESHGAELSFVSLRELEGTYQGLLSHVAAGGLKQGTKPARVTVSLNKTGALSGQLEYLGSMVRFNDALDSDLRMESRIERNGLSALDFSLELDPESKTLVARVSEEGREFVSEATLAVAPDYKKGGAAQAGRYTMLFHEGVTQGAGYLATEVSSKGQVMFVGMTAAGDELTGSAVLQADGSVACYFPLYSVLKSSGGYLGGELEFTEADVAVTGSVEWFKPEQTSKQATTAGFLKTLSLESSRYVVPEKKAPVLAATTGQLSLKLSGYSEPAVVVFGAGAKVELVHQPAGASVELTVSRSTGVVSGAVTDEKTKEKRAVGGVVLQEQGLAGGVYITEAGAGQWVVK